MGAGTSAAAWAASVDITLSELALETFFPADDATALALRRLADETPPAPA
jgi:hypothetical protein